MNVMKAVKVYNNFIFDLDGTLFHTSPSVLSKFASAFDEAGVEVKKELLKEEIMGPPVDMIISGLVPSISETERGLVKEIFRAAYDSDPVTGTSFFPGVEKTLKTLKDSGKKLFMATNKPVRSTEKIIARFIPGLLDAVYTPDVFKGKIMTKTQMIEKIISDCGLFSDETVMIGDTQGDISAASAAGVESVLVLWGYGADKEQLRGLSDFSAAVPRDLLEFI